MTKTEDERDTALSSPLPALPRELATDSVDLTELSPLATELRPAPAGIRICLNALRRHWRLGFVLGGVCAGVAAIAAWCTYPAYYTATVLVRLEPGEEQLVFGASDRGIEDYEVHKNTQRQLLKCDFVLDAAMRRPEIVRLMGEHQGSESFRGMAGRAQVDFPGNAEIMRVQLSADDPVAAATVVNGVMDAYMDEVVNLRRNQRSRRLQELDRLYTDREADLHRRRTQFNQVVERLGTGETGAISLKQQMAVQEYGDLRRDLRQLQIEQRRVRAELQAKQAQRSEAKSIDFASATRSLSEDPVTQQLVVQRNALLDAIAMNQQNRRPGARYSGQYEQQAEILRQQVETRRRAQIETDAANLESRLAILTDQEQGLAADIERARGQLERLGGTPADVEIMSAEIKRLDSMLTSIADERDRLKIELQSGGRVVPLQRARVPQSLDTGRRLQFTAVSGLLGFMVPLFGIVFWDVQGYRINSSDDLASPLGLRVLGTVPVVPRATINPSQSLPPRRRRWRTALEQAVNGVAARVICAAKADGPRVLLVSSAVSGEGKTTLASQLARSLAREGYHTLLLDFDLRKPALHNVFKIRLGPGVSDLVGGICGFKDVEHEVAPNLSVVTAGNTGSLSLRILASERIAAIFDRGRDAFEFVIVDAPPILPIADACLVSRHVDAVILSVLRDVSRVPEVMAAARALTAFGISRVGAVMIGSSHEVY